MFSTQRLQGLNRLSLQVLCPRSCSGLFRHVASFRPSAISGCYRERGETPGKKGAMGQSAAGAGTCRNLQQISQRSPEFFSFLRDRLPPLLVSQTGPLADREGPEETVGKAYNIGSCSDVSLGFSPNLEPTVAGPVLVQLLCRGLSRIARHVEEQGREDDALQVGGCGQRVQCRERVKNRAVDVKFNVFNPLLSVFGQKFQEGVQCGRIVEAEAAAEEERSGLGMRGLIKQDEACVGLPGAVYDAARLGSFVGIVVPD
ncbi:hypothetical protein MPH_00070 [Macrophomina phaseolina MS6]|uniref:Uncharacterized protein n=1 Tax=Macrophomina phaseolina (strain MS6) TaxID=1126212 RepID=K2SCC6_MACPH|nr:hypothetical protein MPH_00070 [Macrophomina phaseolina MS6]